MATVSISISNINKATDSIPVYADKSNLNFNTLKVKLEDIYNNINIDVVNKSLGTDTALTKVASKNYDVFLPTSGYEGTGINFVQNSVSIASIKTNGVGKVDAVLNNIAANQVTTTGAISTSSTINAGSTTDVSSIGLLSSGNAVFDGGFRRGVADVAISATANLATVSLDKTTQSRKVVTITPTNTTSQLTVALPSISDSSYEGYEYTLCIKTNNSTPSSSNLVLSCNGGFINNGTTAYTLSTGYSTSVIKTVTFVYHGTSGQVLILSVI